MTTVRLDSVVHAASSSLWRSKHHAVPKAIPQPRARSRTLLASLRYCLKLFVPSTGRVVPA